jgi:hypothetical protein
LHGEDVRLHGSAHTIAHSIYDVSQVSIVPPYVVLPEADGEVHAIHLDDWTDENLTNDDAKQYMAASDGKRVVWIDYKYLTNPEVPEVVVYDFATKAAKRITFSEKKPSNKWHPTIEGDWVAWTDDRDSEAPNTSIDNPRDRLDIYGYNLKTNQEVHLVGNTAGEINFLYPALPRLHRGKLYVLGQSGKYSPQYFEFQLPAP